MSETVIYTKDSLKARLLEIKERGWIASSRPANTGSVGNTLEDLLGIEENNLPLPNAAEWELKCQRNGTNSLTTLFHMEPSPTALKLVSSLLLPNYGWPHKKAGIKYPQDEMSFRQTISCIQHSDRGFKVKVDWNNRRVSVSFDSKAVLGKHGEWLDGVLAKVSDGDLSPQPYWGFDDLCHKAGTKLHNCFFIGADVKKIDGVEHYWYNSIMMLQGFSGQHFIEAIERGDALVDFDARTGHNHGTKFRFRRSKFFDVYDEVSNVTQE